MDDSDQLFLAREKKKRIYSWFVIVEGHVELVK
jgi:hypothetical protein